MLLLQVDWGTVPEWVGGVGTAAALFATVVVLRMEIRRFRSDDESRRREQASKISAWLTEPEFQQMPAWGRTIPVGPQTFEIMVRNASDSPAYNVVVTFIIHHPDEQTEPVRVGFGHVPPDETLSSTRELAEDSRLGTGYDVSVHFTDSAGLHWTRDGFGNLTQVKEPAAVC